MAKELSEDSKFQVSIKTLISIVVAVATIMSAYFGLMASTRSFRKTSAGNRYVHY